MSRTYSELVKIPTLIERYKYLRLEGKPGQATFGFERFLNQRFYTSQEWRDTRRAIALRDNGCDLGLEDWPIMGKIYIHHMNPLTRSMIVRKDDALLDPDNLISVSLNTHNAIHYGTEELLPQPYTPRRKGDTKLW